MGHGDCEYFCIGQGRREPEVAFDNPVTSRSPNSSMFMSSEARGHSGANQRYCRREWAQSYRHIRRLRKTESEDQRQDVICKLKGHTPRPALVQLDRESLRENRAVASSRRLILHTVTVRGAQWLNVRVSATEAVSVILRGGEDRHAWSMLITVDALLQQPACRAVNVWKWNDDSNINQTSKSMNDQLQDCGYYSSG